MRGAQAGRSEKRRLDLKRQICEAPTSRKRTWKAPTSMGAHLECASLEGANLERALARGGEPGTRRVDRANLEGAALEGANLERALLVEANLEDVDLWSTPSGLRKSNRTTPTAIIRRGRRGGRHPAGPLAGGSVAVRTVRVGAGA